jgi:hypothetical protein
MKRWKSVYYLFIAIDTVLLAVVAIVLAIGGCNSSMPEPPKVVHSTVGNPEVSPQAAKETFVIDLYFSEYPAWSSFGVAAKQGIIDGARGKLGTIEKKWNVDIVLHMPTYEICLSDYGTKGGAVCITNTDIVGIVGSRPSTAIMPTSTSYGADACVAVGVADVDALKKETTYGLSNSVSDYAWFRGLEKLGKNPADYKFQMRDPEQEAQALQIGASKVGMIWNPFTLQTLRKKKDSKILFDSTIIPDEIVDMVVMDNVTLHKPGGDAAAKCICDTYYTVCDNLKTPGKLSDDTYIALGDQFANLSLEDMKLCADMASNPDKTKNITTRFYDTPELGEKVFDRGHMDPILTEVLRWATIRQIIKGGSLFISYRKEDNQFFTTLTFDSTYMRSCR